MLTEKRATENRRLSQRDYARVGIRLDSRASSIVPDMAPCARNAAVKPQIAEGVVDQRFTGYCSMKEFRLPTVKIAGDRSSWQFGGGAP